MSFSFAARASYLNGSRARTENLKIGARMPSAAASSLYPIWAATAAAAAADDDDDDDCDAEDDDDDDGADFFFAVLCF